MKTLCRIVHFIVAMMLIVALYKMYKFVNFKTISWAQVELKKKDSRQEMSDFPMKTGQTKNGVHPVTSPGK